LLASLGIASNVLTDRLNRLVDTGVLDRIRYSERPERFEYHLTEKGVELGVALLALMQRVDRHLSEKPPTNPPRRSDRSPVSVRIVAKDGSTVTPHELEFVPGPGLKPVRPGTRASRPARTRSAGLEPAFPDYRREAATRLGLILFRGLRPSSRS